MSEGQKEDQEIIHEKDKSRIFKYINFNKDSIFKLKLWKISIALLVTLRLKFKFWVIYFYDSISYFYCHN